MAKTWLIFEYAPRLYEGLSCEAYIWQFHNKQSSRASLNSDNLLSTQQEF